MDTKTWVFVCLHTENLWDCFRVCLSVSESVRPENLVNTISQEPMKGISPEFGFVDVLIRFRGQKVKITSGSDQENEVNTIS